MTAVCLSVIVPFGPNETEGAVLLEQLRGLPGDAEVVLVRVDGAPRPPALRKSGSYAVGRILVSPPGRARQMNVGAQTARGRWLWFLHADSRLPACTLAALETFLTADRPALGYFDLRYRDGPSLARLNALGANLRARWLGMPFGDQGFVLPAAWFVRMGGYDESVDCGEDHRLVWRARATCLPLRRIAAPLESSARKYAEQGWWSTTTRHLGLTACQAWPQWRAVRRTHGTRTA
ncbi:MAG: glycosyl transferase family 2 [Rhodanobacteraceae bacterium]